MAFAAESRELKAARSLVPEIRAAARAAEQARRLPDTLVRSFSEAGLVQMAVPRQYGGLESHALELLRVTEEVSYGDGSAGWVLMNYQTTALCSGLLPKDWGEAIFAGAERAIPAGVLSPTGRGRRVDGGMIVDGRWGFASGCPGANWLLATAIMEEESGEPGDKGPSVRLPMIPRSDFTIEDTWHVTGLCGSGSHHVVANETFVPEGRWITLDDPPAVETTLYRVPIVSIFPPCVVAVSLGIARAALEEFESLAKGKVPALSRRPLSERGSAQIDFARAEALVGAARSYVYEATEALWDEVDRGDEASVETRRRARLASTYAAAACAEAVDLLYTAAGSSAIFLDNPLQRYWRDVHTATQHLQIAATGFENMGRLRLTGEIQGPF